MRVAGNKSAVTGDKMRVTSNKIAATGDNGNKSFTRQLILGEKAIHQVKKHATS